LLVCKLEVCGVHAVGVRSITPMLHFHPPKQLKECCSNTTKEHREEVLHKEWGMHETSQIQNETGIKCCS